MQEQTWGPFMVFKTKCIKLLRSLPYTLVFDNLATPCVYEYRSCILRQEVGVVVGFAEASLTEYNMY